MNMPMSEKLTGIDQSCVTNFLSKMRSFASIVYVDQSGRRIQLRYLRLRDRNLNALRSILFLLPPRTVAGPTICNGRGRCDKVEAFPVEPHDSPHIRFTFLVLVP
jgi:hypothetical protein